jgi:hypothetical protein
MIPDGWKYITIHTAELQYVSWHLLFAQIIELGSMPLPRCLKLASAESQS